MVPAVNPKIPLEDSFKRQGGIIQLEAIKEDRGDDDYCKYNDDFEPHYPEEQELIVKKKSTRGGARVVAKENANHPLLDNHLNPKSAEPHLHKSKLKNLKPLQELCNQVPQPLHEARTP